MSRLSGSRIMTISINQCGGDMKLNPRNWEKFLDEWNGGFSTDTYGSFYAETFGFDVDDPVRQATDDDAGKTKVWNHATRHMSLGEYDDDDNVTLAMQGE